MKHIKKFYESNSNPKVKNDIKEIEELCVWLKDEVNNVKIEYNGGSSKLDHYNIEIRFSGDVNSINKIVENAEKMLEITKEYTELLFKLEDSGYEISYQLLQTSQHLNFYHLTGKIQLSKTS